MLSRLKKAFRKSGRVSLPLRPKLEFLEDRTTPVASLIDLASAGVPNFPIPAGSTLIDTSDSGKQILFSSMDTNVVAGQQSLPGVNNLYWMDISQSVTAPTIRLVTHFAGNALQATGYNGVGGGLLMTFEAGSASISGDGQSVVFDSRINANSYDATVPYENDRPDTPFNLSLALNWQAVNGNVDEKIADILKTHDTGTPDVFVWHADASDPNHNITLVSLLNDTGKAEALVIQPNGPWSPAPTPPDPTKAMAVGVFGQLEFMVFYNDANYQIAPPVLSEFFQMEAETRNCGVSINGDRVLYSTQVPANWIDTLNPNIKDVQYPLVTPDGFLVGGAKVVGAANLEKLGQTQTATIDINGNALGLYHPEMVWNEQQNQNVPVQMFEPQFLQLSGNGERVVYSARQTAVNIVAGSTDTDFSLDVFAFQVASGKNLLISRKDNQTLVAAGSDQPNYAPYTDISFYDTQNLAVSDDGLSIALSSSAANLVGGWTNNNVGLLQKTTFSYSTMNPNPPPVINTKTYNLGQHAPTDLYAFRDDQQKTLLVNTPDGVSNTNTLATFGGMSNDGSTWLFGTTANNFYSTPFSNPPYPPFGQGPLPPNFLLGGFSNLWARNINAGTSVLISVSADGKSSGNQATMADIVDPATPGSLTKISDSGRYVLFSSTSNNLVTGIVDRGFKGGTFLRDMKTGVTRLASTVAGGNLPSQALITGSAISTDDSLSQVTITLGGTGGRDMQTRFRAEEVTPGAHIYTTTYPQMTPPASNSNANIVAITTPGAGTVVVYEYRGADRTTKAMPNPFPGYYGELRVATGDTNADGIADYLFATGAGVKSATVIIDGQSQAVIGRYQPFPNFMGGAYVALGDVNNDGYADPIFGAGEGGTPHIVAFSGKNGTVLRSFYAFAQGFRGGVRVTTGDVNNDNYSDMVATPGVGGAPQVVAFSGLDNTVLLSFWAGNTSYRGGLQVASSDMDGDGFADILTAPDKGNTVSVFSGAQNGKLIATYNAGAQFAGGVRLSAREGRILLASAAGVPPVARIVAFDGLVEVSTFSPFGTTYNKGQFIG